MSKIAFITCSNLKNELNCSSVLCHQMFNQRQGKFAQYQKDKDYELVGTISCAGCPTAVGQEKILAKIQPLVEFSQADKVHLSSCMAAVCPFINKYVGLIKDKYPKVEVIVGTHVPANEKDAQQELEQFKGMVKGLLSQPRPNITDAVKSAPKK